MKRTFQIYRYDPDKDTKPYMQTVEIELDGHERMLLDAGNIKNLADQYSQQDTGQLTVAATHTQARYTLP